VPNRFAGSENIRVRGELTIAWETVRERVKISAKEMLYVNESILNHCLKKTFRIFLMKEEAQVQCLHFLAKFLQIF